MKDFGIIMQHRVDITDAGVYSVWELSKDVF